MNTHHRRNFLLLPLFLGVALMATRLEADPTGLPYSLTLENLPATVGPLSVTFDADKTMLGPPPVEVWEMATDVEGGELLEFWFRTIDGPLAQDPEKPAAVWIEDLSWDGLEGSIVENSGFIYFTVDGVPQPMQDGAGLAFGNHPLNADIRVLFLGNEGGGTSLHVSTEDVAPGLSIGDFMGGIGLNPAEVNDMHIGVLVEHVPEASMGLLALSGLGSLLLVRRGGFQVFV